MTGTAPVCSFPRQTAAAALLAFFLALLGGGVQAPGWDDSAPHQTRDARKDSSAQPWRGEDGGRANVERSKKSPQPWTGGHGKPDWTGMGRVLPALPAPSLTGASGFSPAISHGPGRPRDRSSPATGPPPA